MKLLRALRLGLIFLATLVATAAGLSCLDPIGEVPELREKWAYWREHKDEFDTVFIGTSRIYHGIMPSVFDELTAAAGAPTHTFNFGINGMFSPEDGYVARQILGDPPRNLRWVVSEVGGFSKDFNGRNLENVRSVYWHDWPRTSLVIRAVLESPGKNKWRKWFRTEKHEQSRAALAAAHFRVFISKSLNLARGSDVLNRRFFNDERVNPNVVGRRRDGFVAMPDSEAHSEALTFYQQSYTDRLKEPARVSRLGPYAEENFAQMVTYVRAIGARPIALLTPTTIRRREYPASALGVPVLDFCDVQAYPQLFGPEVRCDIAHLNEKGADVFTRLVAEKFIALLKAQPNNPR